VKMSVFSRRNYFYIAISVVVYVPCCATVNTHAIVNWKNYIITYNITSYYGCFVTWNRKTSTLDIFARHPKIEEALLCLDPKLWKFDILDTSSEYTFDCKLKKFHEMSLTTLAHNQHDIRIIRHLASCTLQFWSNLPKISFRGKHFNYLCALL
jgi:hypothetical protein